MMPANLASQCRGSDEYRQGRAGAERGYPLGRAVRGRRLALGLSQVELATRAGMTQPGLSRLEAVNVLQSRVRFPTPPRCSPNCPPK